VERGCVAAEDDDVVCMAVVLFTVVNLLWRQQFSRRFGYGYNTAVSRVGQSGMRLAHAGEFKC
jgi:hypothetical protein